jgi:hypothetical protein
MSDRSRHETFQHPSDVVAVHHAPHLANDRFPWRWRKARQKPALAFGFHQPLQRQASVGRDKVEHSLTVDGHKRVQIDDVRDSLGRTIGDAGNHNP